MAPSSDTRHGTFGTTRVCGHGPWPRPPSPPTMAAALARLALLSVVLCSTQPTFTATTGAPPLPAMLKCSLTMYFPHGLSTGAPFSRGLLRVACVVVWWWWWWGACACRVVARARVHVCVCVCVCVVGHMCGRRWDGAGNNVCWQAAAQAA